MSPTSTDDNMSRELFSMSSAVLSASFTLRSSSRVTSFADAVVTAAGLVSYVISVSLGSKPNSTSTSSTSTSASIWLLSLSFSFSIRKASIESLASSSCCVSAHTSSTSASAFHADLNGVNGATLDVIF